MKQRLWRAMEPIILWFSLASIIHTPTAHEASLALGIRPLFSLQLVKPEPVENAVFALTLIAGIGFCILAAYAWAILSPSPSSVMTTAITAVCGLAVAAVWLFSMHWDSIYPPSPSSLVAAAGNHRRAFRNLCLVAAVGLSALSFIAARPRLKYLPVIASAVPLALLSRMVLMNNDDTYIANTHYEVFVYPLIQDWLGQGIHLGQLSQYGMYPIFLRPVWALTGGPTTVAISSVMAALLFLAHAALIIFMVRFAKHSTLAATFSLLGIVVALLFYPFWPGDAYFEFFPVRLVFPALAMTFLCWESTRERHRFVCYIALAFGLAWNFESGIIGLALYSIFTLALGFTPNVPALARMVIRQAIMALGAAAVAAATIGVYYLIRFGNAPDLTGALTMIRAFSAGAGAEPMPAFGAWAIHVVIYGASVFVGVRALWHTPEPLERQRAAALLAMAFMGLLWLRYYQGRSLPLPLTWVSMPALCCAGLLADRAISLLSSRQLIAAALMSTFVGGPLLAALSLWIWDGPVPQRPLKGILHERADARFTMVVDRVVEAFEAVKQRDTDELLTLAPYAHLVNLRIGKPSPIKAAGMCQLWFESELFNATESLSDPNTRLVVFGNTDTCITEGMLRSDPRFEEVLQHQFTEIPPWGSCSFMPPDDTHIFVRNGTSGPAFADSTASSTVNVALHKAATESSSGFGSHASAAVDGNTDGRFAEASTTHTQLQPAPWWEVDLGTTTEVDSVEVWNRTDCCSERLRDYWVFASERPFSPADTPATLNTRTDVFSSYREVAPCPKITVRINKPARYIRVQLQGTDYLSLAEVRVLHR